MIITNKESIKKVINKHYDTLEDKIDDIKEKFIFEADPNLKTKLQNAKIQINKILQNYDKLSKNELTLEEKVLFAYYIIHLFENVNKKIDISKFFDIDDVKLETSIRLMKSSDIHDKVIGIDNFMSLTHTLNPLLVNLVLILNGIDYKFTSDYDIYLRLGEHHEKEDYHYEYDEMSKPEKKNVRYAYYYIEKIANDFIEKLNYIRNRKGLGKIKFETLDNYYYG